MSERENDYPKLIMYFTLRDLGGHDKSEDGPMGFVEPSPPAIDCIDFVTDRGFFPYVDEPTVDSGFSIRDSHIRFNSIRRNSGLIIESLKEGEHLFDCFARLDAALRADQGVMTACRRVNSFLSGLREAEPDPGA